MEKAKRIFVALPISEELQKEILDFIESKLLALRQDQKSTIRWLKGKNLHITLVPPWYELDINNIIDRLKNVHVPAFHLSFHTVAFGPNPREPRIVWAEGNSDETINSLRLALYHQSGQQPEKRPFKLHLTLARFRPEDFKDFPIKNLHEQVDWRQQATKFVLMQSHLSPEGSDYEVLAEFKLNG